VVNADTQYLCETSSSSSKMGREGLSINILRVISFQTKKAISRNWGGFFYW